MDEMIPAAFGTLLCVLLPIVLVKTILDHKIRRMAIEKGLVNQDLKHLYLYTAGPDTRAPAAVKWGLMMVGVGLAFLIGLLVPSNLQAEVTVGCAFLLAGLGLIVYYAIAKKLAPETDS
jgi:hypothetical protein